MAGQGYRPQSTVIKREERARNRKLPRRYDLPRHNDESEGEMKKKTIRKRAVRFDYEFNHGEWAALKVCARRMDKTLEEFLRYLVDAEIRLVVRDYRDFAELEMTDEEKTEFYKEHGEPEWAREVSTYELPN